jgi:NADP-dependent 3-hydroxy acid dehydrogenase YdfG
VIFSLVKYNISLNQDQKVAIVTGNKSNVLNTIYNINYLIGANSGIGYVTAEYLYKAGYYVILGNFINSYWIIFINN